MPADRAALIAACNQLLQPECFKDYAPNGLQVQGKSEIRKLVSGVTASRALIEAAIDAGADALLVHHGLFWRGQDGTITGWMRQRLRPLLAHDLNLLAYHLPLDAHPVLGNNAQLGRVLGLTPRDTRFGEYGLGMIGQRADGGVFADAQALAEHVSQCLGRPFIGELIAGQAIETVAWCSGGAQDWFEAAIAAGADAFITGEISEPQAHLARECGVSFIACGHHATERYGVAAVGAYMAEQFGLTHQFIDIGNPA